MPTISQNLPDTFSVEINQKTFRLRSVQYPDDMPLLYKWMHAEHVVEHWQLHLPMPQLRAHLERVLADDHHHPYIITCDGKPFGYTEIYEAARDRLAFYYDAKKSDMGCHILLGELATLGRGYLRPTIMIIHKLIFEHTDALKAVGEPDVRVEAFNKVAEGFNYRVQKRIKMPEKEAVLFFCERDDFYKSSEYLKLCGND